MKKDKPKFTIRATSPADFKEKFEALKHHGFIFKNGRNNDEDEEAAYVSN